MCVVSLCAWGVLSSRVWVGLLCVCVNGCVCVCSRVCRCLSAHGSRIVSPSNHVPSVLALELSQVMHFACAKHLIEMCDMTQSILIFIPKPNFL